MNPILRERGGPEEEKAIRIIDQLTDEQLQWIVASQEDPKRTFLPGKFELPIVTSQLGNLSLLPDALQTSIIEIQFELTQYNRLVDDIQRYHDMTFLPELSAANFDRVQTNLNETYHRVADRTVGFARRIGAFLQECS